MSSKRWALTAVRCSALSLDLETTGIPSRRKCGKLFPSLNRLACEMYPLSNHLKYRRRRQTRIGPNQNLVDRQVRKIEIGSKVEPNGTSGVPSKTLPPTAHTTTPKSYSAPCCVSWQSPQANARNQRAPETIGLTRIEDLVKFVGCYESKQVTFPASQVLEGH